MQFYDLRELFRHVFESAWQPEDLAEFDELREKFAFHMAEICGSLPALAKIYASEPGLDVAKVSHDVDFFFNDAMPHLIAAAQIFGDIPQIFEEQNGVHDWDSFVDDGQDDEPAKTEPLAAAK